MEAGRKKMRRNGQIRQGFVVTSLSLCVQCVLEQRRRLRVHYRCVVGRMGRVFARVPFPALCIYVCNRVCVFYSPCALVCVGCCACPCELLGVSGSRPSSPLRSPRTLLLASLSSPFPPYALCSALLYPLFYSVAGSMTNRSTVKSFASVNFHHTDNIFSPMTGSRLAVGLSDD